MKTLALVLASGAVALFVWLFSNTYVGDLKFYLRAMPVEMTIDGVTAEKKYVTAPRVAGIRDPYFWDIEITAHDKTRKWLLRDPVGQNISEVNLLLESKGKRQTLWVLPESKFSTRYSLKNAFPTKWLVPLVISVVMLLVALIGLVKTIIRD